MINLQSIQEEIANNLLNQLDQIIESGDETELDNWLSSLTEEQIEMLELTDMNRWKQLFTATNPGQDAPWNSLQGAGNFIADVNPLTGIPRSIARYNRGEQSGARTGADIGLSVAGGPILKGIGKGLKGAWKTGSRFFGAGDDAAKAAAKGAPTPAPANRATERQAEILSRRNAADASRGGPRPDPDDFNARRAMATDAEVVSSARAGARTNAAPGSAPSAASPNPAAAARGGAPPGGAITSQTRALPVPPKPQTNLPAVRPTPTASVPAVRPPTGGAPTTTKPAVAPSVKTGAALTAAATTAAVATAPRANIPNSDALKPTPGEQARMASATSTPAPAAKPPAAAPAAKPPAAAPSAKPKPATVTPQRPKAAPPATMKPQRPAAKPAQKQSFGFKGTATGTAGKDLSAGQITNRALGGVYEQKNTMADFKMHIYEMMERNK